MNLEKTGLMVLIICFSLINGCASQKVEPVAAQEPVAIKQEIMAEPVVESRITAVDAIQSMQKSQPAFIDNETTIYFSYDSSELSYNDRISLADHIRYLKANPAQKITVEGYADARGSNEYNLTLGEMRANAIKQIMLEENVRDSQIELVSYGENRPAMEGEGEQVWRLNRRATIVYSEMNTQLSSN